MCATVSSDSVHSPTWQPMRAAANAASTPACPAPTTITSNVIDTLVSRSFPYAEPLEDVREHVLARVRADDLVQAHARCVQIGEHEFLGRAGLGSAAAAPASSASRACSSSAAWRTFEIAVRIAQRLPAGERVDNRVRADRSSPAPVVADTHIDIVARPRRWIDRSCSRRPAAWRVAVSSSSRASSAVSALCAVEHDDDQIGNLAGTRAARRRPRSPPRRSSRARPPYRRASLSIPSMSHVSVTRSRVVPGVVGDDRARMPEKRIEQARLPDVGPPGNHHRRTVANDPPACGRIGAAHRAPRSRA